MTRCGFIALIGAPNAGKSTLLNALVGTKLAIVSPKVQTTRTRTLGILTENETQMIFVDTPGIFEPRRRLDRAMVSAAWTGADDADVVVLLADATRPRLSRETHTIMTRLAQAKRQVVLALTKIDLVKRDQLLPLAAQANESGIVTDTFMISSTKQDGLDDLKAHLAGSLPESPFLYPADDLSDQPLRRIAAEITREQLYLQLNQELPYESTVETEHWEEFDNGSVKISQAIFVERDGQKKIILGKGGAQIRDIGTKARLEMETLMGRKVHLTLFVKVRGEWMEDSERYREMGLEFDV
jgi:GTP-binding protein Era